MHIFQLEIPRKKRDILSEKRDGAKKKREFTPESGSVDTYVYMLHISINNYIYNFIL